MGDEARAARTRGGCSGDHLGSSSRELRASNLGKGQVGCGEGAGWSWSQRCKPCPSSAVSTGRHTADHTPGLLALTQASVGTAWLPGPAGLRAHGEGHRLITHERLAGGVPLSMW